MTALLTPILSAFAAFVGSWLAAQWALDRFRSEKIWERRAAAYTVIFDALHDQARWFGTHLNAMDTGRELSSAEREQLTKEARASSTVLQRRVDSETWLLSDAVIERIADLVGDLEKARKQADFRESVELGENAIETAMEDLRVLVRRELNIS